MTKPKTTKKPEAKRPIMRAKAGSKLSLAKKKPEAKKPAEKVLKSLEEIGNIHKLKPRMTAIEKQFKQAKTIEEQQAIVTAALPIFAESIMVLGEFAGNSAWDTRWMFSNVAIDFETASNKK